MTFLKSTFCILFIGIALSLTAQNDADVQRYSSHYVFGTARFNGLGGAMGALGGDMSATHINPASLGVYRFGTISFTPSIEANSIESTLNRSTLTDVKVTPVVNNIGFVLASELKDPYWKYFNFGVSYNRLNTFNDQLKTFSQIPLNESLMQDFALEANGSVPRDLSEYSSGLAYNGFVIDETDTINHLYSGRALYGKELGGEIKQAQTAKRSGRLSETSINFGTNYDDIFYLGASLNFQSVYYKSVVETAETPTDLTNTDLISYTFREELKTEGLGFNFKLGGIIKAGKILRFGASVQTPTTFSLTDNFQNVLSSKFRDPNFQYDPKSSVGIFDYRLKTPWRFMASAAGIIGKKGLISVQYEFVDFASGELKNAKTGGYDGNFGNANNVIADSYGYSNIIRAGGEYRATESVYLRAGFAYFSNPNKANETSFGGLANLNRYQYSGGIGYRAASWNIDLAYQLAQVEEIYLTNNSANLGTLKDNYTNIALTIGFRL